MSFPRGRGSHRWSITDSHDPELAPKLEISSASFNHSFFFNRQLAIYLQYLDLDLDHEIRWHSTDLGTQQLDVRLARGRKAFVQCAWQHRCNHMQPPFCFFMVYQASQETLTYSAYFRLCRPKVSKKTTKTWNLPLSFVQVWFVDTLLFPPHVLQTSVVTKQTSYLES